MTEYILMRTPKELSLADLVLNQIGIGYIKADDKLSIKEGKQ